MRTAATTFIYLLLIAILEAKSLSHESGEGSAEEEQRLIHKATHETYEAIIDELTKGRSQVALAEFSEIMNNEQLSREERNEKLDEWGEKNNCEDEVGAFKIKEELVEEEGRKEKIRKIDMLSSVSYEIQNILNDPEVEEFQRKEVIDALVSSSSEKIRPLLYLLYPSLLKDQISTDEIINQRGNNILDKLSDTNDIISNISQREDITLVKKKEMIEGFIRNANTRVAAVLNSLWPKIYRRKRRSNSGKRRYFRARIQRRVKDFDEMSYIKEKMHSHRPTKIPPFYDKDSY